VSNYSPTPTLPGMVSNGVEDGAGDLSDLVNRAAEALGLLLELISVLKAKSILTEEEIDEMGKRANLLRGEILRGEIPS
jgi:hypothetical protein